MMGRQTGDERHLFYLINLDERIAAGPRPTSRAASLQSAHLMRRVPIGERP